MLPEPFSLIPQRALFKISLSEGALLFRRSDAVSGMYFLMAGEVQLLRYGADGSEIVIHRAFAGESFAEASLFSDNYHCDALASTSCEVTRIDKQEVLKLLQSNPEFAISLTSHLSKQVQAYRRLMELRAIKSAEQRVLVAVSEGRLQGSIKAFASQIGLAHETTYRALSTLVHKEHLQKTARGTYSIYEDPGGLTGKISNEQNSC